MAEQAQRLTPEPLFHIRHGNAVGSPMGTPADGYRKQPKTEVQYCASIREAVAKWGDSWVAFAPKEHCYLHMALDMERRKEAIVMRCHEEGRLSRVRTWEIEEGERLEREAA